MGLLNIPGHGGSKLSPLKDPFKKNNISDISINFSTLFKPDWRATVTFKNGNTTGKQSFHVDGEGGFAPIVQQMEEFIKSLE